MSKQVDDLGAMIQIIQPGGWLARANVNFKISFVSQAGRLHQQLPSEAFPTDQWRAENQTTLAITGMIASKHPSLVAVAR
jgi:hypothetical protein